MQEIEVKKRGGRREGAGRPRGSGRFGEPTATVRVPARLLERVNYLIERHQRGIRRPLVSIFDMAAINAKRG